MLLFALVAFASAADDDVTQGPNDVEVCEDNQDVCDDLIGNLMCQLPSAGVRRMQLFIRNRMAMLSYGPLNNN